MRTSRPLGSRLPSTTSPTGSGSAAIARVPAAIAGDPRRVEREPVEQRRAQAAGAARLHVARVGLDDLVGARDQRVGDRLQRGVLRVGVQRRQRARGGARLPGRSSETVRVAVAMRRRVRQSRRLSSARSSRGGSPRRSRAACTSRTARGLHPLDLAELVGGVVADPLADDDRAVRDLHGVAGVEGAAHLGDADRQQRRAAVAQRPRRAGVDDDRAARRLGVAQPQLERGVARLAGAEARALRLAVERGAERARRAGRCR